MQLSRGRHAVVLSVLRAPTAALQARRYVAAVAVAVAVGALATPALAVPGHVLGGSFGTPGSLPGEFSTPVGIAVSPASHDVLVADEGNGRVQRFAVDGSFISSFDGSTTPNGSMSPCAIAIDPVSGDIYVADEFSPVVQKFSAAGVHLSQIPIDAIANDIAVDPTNGDLYVASSALGAGVSVFDATGTLRFVITGAGTEGQISEAGAVTVDATGTVYVAEGSFPGSAVIRRFTTAGAYVSTVSTEGLAPRALSGDSLGGLFVFETPSSPQITHLDAADTRLFVFGAGAIGFHTTSGWPSSPHLAVDQDSGRVYVADQSANKIVYFDEVTLPDVTTGPASNETTDGATISGLIDPLGIATSYRFDYGLTQEYGASTPEASAGDGTGPVPVDAVLGSLQPNQTYHFRLIGTNASGASAGGDRALTTDTAPPAVDATPPTASNVRAANARLTSTVNPNNLPTSYHFAYGTSEAALDSSTAAEPAGSGFGDVQVSQLVTGLEPATTYFFRVVADNGTGGPIAGSSGTFTTAPARPAVTLQPVSGVTGNSVTLHATVDANGLSGTYRFSIAGVNSAYSSVTPETALNPGDGAQAISATVSDLRADSRFSVRAIATTTAGATQSDALEFKTLPASFVIPPPPAADLFPYGCASPRLTGYRGKAVPGRTITVLGTDLGRSGVLNFGSAVADTSRWTSAAIRVVVPKGIRGRVQLRADCATLSNSLTVRVVKPKPRACKRGQSRKIVKRGGKRVSRCVKLPRRGKARAKRSSTAARG